MNYLVICIVLTAIPTVFGGIEQCPVTIQDNKNVKLFEATSVVSCYEFVLSHPVDWKHADTDCRSRGGHLVDIHSSAENYFIFKTLRELGYINDEGIWIGLTDVEKEGNWHWARTSGALNYKNWASGQPGLFGTFEDCVVLQVTDGKWHDFPCTGFLFTSQKHGWVCKYAASPPLPPMSVSIPMVSTPMASAAMASSPMASSPMGSAPMASSPLPTVPMASVSSSPPQAFTSEALKPIVVTSYVEQVVTGRRASGAPVFPDTTDGM